MKITTTEAMNKLAALGASPALEIGDDDLFPSEFVFGVAASSFQIEGDGGDIPEVEPEPDTSEEAPPRKTRRQAMFQIVVADLSMSLDNVLAVAGIARDHTWVLITGLVFSVAFMGLAAAYIARLLERHHWIAYVGLAVIFYVAIEMIATGAQDLMFLSRAGDP